MGQPSPQTQDVPGAIDCRLHRSALPALLIGGDEVLSPSLGPLHGPPQIEGEGRDRILLGIDGCFGTEAASDIGCDDPNLVGRESQVGGQVGPDRMRRLSRGPHSETPIDFVPRGEHSPPLHGGQSTSMLVHLDRHHAFRGIEGSVHIAEAGGEGAHEVRP